MSASSRAPGVTHDKAVRLLVVIASFGSRNRDLLRRVIHRYQQMPFAVDIVVVSEAPKDLGPGVRVVVGLPSSNPWSLPFVHKRVFQQNRDRYDLFAYSEDDIEITEENIRAFLDLTPTLAHDEIAGFLRYEVDRVGARSLPDVHGAFHWKPSSVRVRGPHVVAEFTNEHAAFYLLTRQQLTTAIASGGFLREPYSGKYDMLCTAATDPYTSCGFRKVVCVSSLPRFLIHHLSNRYAGAVGQSEREFAVQIGALMQIARGERSTAQLLDGITLNPVDDAGLDYYEKANATLLGFVPDSATEVLCIASGRGNLEHKLLQSGRRVTALPLDAIIGAHLESAGASVVHGNFLDSVRQLAGRHFDCVILPALLNVVSCPGEIVLTCSKLLRPGGIFLLYGPNHERAPARLARLRRSRALQAQPAVSQPLGLSQLRRLLAAGGVRPERIIWQDSLEHLPVSGAITSSRSPRRLAFAAWRRFRAALLRIDFALRFTSSEPLACHGGIGRLVSKTWILRARKPVALVGRAALASLARREPTAAL